MKPVPKGCDSQGRYPEAAESATEVGVEDDFEPDYTATVKDLAIAVVIICCIALVLSVVLEGI